MGVLTRRIKTFEVCRRLLQGDAPRQNGSPQATPIAKHTSLRVRFVMWMIQNICAVTTNWSSQTYIKFQIIENAAQIPENKLEIVCIIQLGIIEPSDFFSLINPINQAIAPVKIIINIALITPTSEKNITPCNNPNSNACIRFAILKSN